MYVRPKLDFKNFVHYSIGSSPLAQSNILNFKQEITCTHIQR